MGEKKPKDSTFKLKWNKQNPSVTEKFNIGVRRASFKNNSYPGKRNICFLEITQKEISGKEKRYSKSYEQYAKCL